MADNVVVIASGETERRSLPHLVSHLRSYLKRDLGRVDDSRPDEIEDPKLRLKNILDQVYTARVSEEIARALDAENIARRSPSFRGFLEAVLNGVARA